MQEHCTCKICRPWRLYAVAFSCALMAIEHARAKGRKLWWGKVILPRSCNLMHAGSTLLSVSISKTRRAYCFLYVCLRSSVYFIRSRLYHILFRNVILTKSEKPKSLYNEVSSSACGLLSVVITCVWNVAHTDCNRVTYMYVKQEQNIFKKSPKTNHPKIHAW